MISQYSTRFFRFAIGQEFCRWVATSKQQRNDADAQVNDQEKKVEFVEQLNLCWLYCPDEVIKVVMTFSTQLIRLRRHLQRNKLHTEISS